ncbi:MAG TPA: imidazole glycerol phosphate synthase subunit HisH [Verrucomicrobiae bacterium]|jgi:glutamine amidotransferase|nr:imidazole glycerol phosphate synthase subunit HisH [Verrucomicrobiae bacterium]
MKTVVIDYGSGNLRSAAKALAAAGADVEVTADPAAVAAAERIVLPGVGAFADCRAGLDRLPGMVEALDQAVRRQGRPFLGICVGMQLMAEAGREHGRHEGLGWIEGEVVPLAPRPVKIPHMGWNELHRTREHPLLAGIAQDADVYFVHSYHLRLGAAEDLLAGADYAGPVVAAIARDNMAGVQFHPEKSQATGLRLLANFLAWRP